MTTKPERDYLDRVASLGCICCRREGHGYSPADIHHLRENPKTGMHYGMSQRAPHYHTIPLCPAHHQYGPEAYHAAPRTWQLKHGTERELWEHVQALLEEIP